MELMIFILLILLFLIFSKLSNIETQLTDIKGSRIKPKPYRRASYKRETSPAPIPTPEVIDRPVYIQPKEPYQPKVRVETVKETFSQTSLEEILFGNVILKVAIVAFILGIGLFLKHSIEQEWFPLWFRVFIGIGVGISMLIAGAKMIENKHKLFSEVLFGGGIAILYLSIYAGFSVSSAFVFMILITILAGFLSVKFDAKSTAIFGLIGGFSTPFLLNVGSGEYVGTLSYMLLLNLGVLYISLYKKWSLLSWLAFGITSLTALASATHTDYDFSALSILYFLFFMIYSIVPFFNEIEEENKQLNENSVFLFWANFVMVILSFLALFGHYKIDLAYYAIITLTLAGYLFTYASYLSKKETVLENLLTIIIGQAVTLVLITPAFLFSGTSLTIIGSIESLMILWIAIQNNNKTYALIALFGFTLTLLRYLSLDMFLNYNKMEILAYSSSLFITSIFIISSFFGAYYLLQDSQLDNNFKEELDNQKLSTFMIGGGIGLLFLFLNVEIYTLLKFYNPLASKFVITLLWVIYGVSLFVYGIKKNIENLKLIGTGLIFIAIIKAFLVDLANLDSIYRIILFLILGTILFALSYFYQKNKDL